MKLFRNLFSSEESAPPATLTETPAHGVEAVQHELEAAHTLLVERGQQEDTIRQALMESERIRKRLDSFLNDLEVVASFRTFEEQAEAERQLKQDLAASMRAEKEAQIALANSEKQYGSKQEIIDRIRYLEARREVFPQNEYRDARRKRYARMLELGEEWARLLAEDAEQGAAAFRRWPETKVVLDVELKMSAGLEPLNWPDGIFNAPRGSGPSVVAFNALKWWMLKQDPSLIESLRSNDPARTAGNFPVEVNRSISFETWA